VYISDVRYTPDGDRSVQGKSVISLELYWIREASVAISGSTSKKKYLRKFSRDAYLSRIVCAPVSPLKEIRYNQITQNRCDRIVFREYQISDTMLLFISAIPYQGTLDVRVYFFLLLTRYLARNKDPFIAPAARFCSCTCLIHNISEV